MQRRALRSALLPLLLCRTASAFNGGNPPPPPPVPISPECTVERCTSYGDWAPDLEPAPPPNTNAAQCCSLCFHHPQCFSWFAGAEGGPSGGASKCHLKAATGDEQKVHFPKTGDCRFTAGYLAHGHHEVYVDGTEGVGLIIFAAICALYLIGGVSVNAVRAGEPKPLSELLPHGAFWRELGGLVVDGAAWTLRGGGSKSDATAPLAASSTGAIVE